jgi:hypothetical protein
VQLVLLGQLVQRELQGQLVQLVQLVLQLGLK